MEAAEELNDLLNVLLNLVHGLLLEGRLLAVVEEQSDVLRSLVELVHECLEGLMTRLLKAHVVVEGVGDQLVNFVLEIEQLLHHLEWLGLQILRKHDLLSLGLDVWVHLLDDELERAVYSIEHVVKEFQFLFLHFAFDEHLLATLVHFGDLLSKGLDALGEYNLDDSWLGLHLKQLVSIGLLFGQVLVHLQDVLVAAHLVAPLFRHLAVEASGRFLEVLLKFLVVNQ